MENQPQPFAQTFPRGTVDRIDQVAAKARFLACVLPDDALGDEANFGFGLILNEIADALYAITATQKQGE